METTWLRNASSSSLSPSSPLRSSHIPGANNQRPNDGFSRVDYIPSISICAFFLAARHDLPILQTMCEPVNSSLGCTAQLLLDNDQATELYRSLPLLPNRRKGRLAFRKTGFHIWAKLKTGHMGFFGAYCAYVLIEMKLERPNLQR